MDLPEETPKPEEPTPLYEDTFSAEPALPEGFTPMVDPTLPARARRRRARRMLVPPGADERATLLDNLARRTFPSFEFFLFAFLSGAVLGAGYLLDLKMNSQALLLLGVLLAPILTPWVGMTLAAVTGSWRFFILTLGGLLVAAGLVFLTGALAGLAGRLWLPLPSFNQANIRTHLWWLDLFIVVLGAVLLVISFLHSEQRPILPSLMLAYGLFMPLSAAGFKLGLGGAQAWSTGLLVALIHLALATLAGLVVLLVLRFKPTTYGGLVLLVLTSLLALYTLAIPTGLVSALRDGINSARPILSTATVTRLPTVVPTARATLTPAVTEAPTLTPTVTATLEPTLAYSYINASAEAGGAYLRSEPGGGYVVSSIANGYLVQVYPEITNVGSVVWVRVHWIDKDGWLLQSILTASTAIPTPSPTPTATR